MRRRRVGAALAIMLLAAGGVTAAVTQDDDSSPAVLARPDQATLDGLTAGASVAPTAVGSASMSTRALSGAGGSGDSAGNAQAVDESAAAVASPASAPAGPDGPRIVKRADLRVEVKEGGFRAAFERAAAVAGAHGGFVSSSTSRTASDGDNGDEADLSSGTLVLRVPAAAFDAARADLSGLGEVTSEVIDGEDVGGQLVDLDARIRSLQVEEEALRALMAKARTVGETIEVQQQLTRVRQQIEQAAGQRANLADAAALATIRANLFEPGVEVRTEPGDPNPVAEGLRDAIDGSMAVLGGTLVVIGYLLPFGLLALAGWGVWRLVVRRRSTVTPAPTA